MLVETDTPILQAPTESPLPGMGRALGACPGFHHQAGMRQDKFMGLRLSQPQHGCPVPGPGERVKAENAHWQGNETILPARGRGGPFYSETGTDPYPFFPQGLKTQSITSGPPRGQSEVLRHPNVGNGHLEIASLPRTLGTEVTGCS